MRFLISLATAMFLCLVLFSPLSAADGADCATARRHGERLRTDPEYRDRMRAAEARISSALAEDRGRADTVYTLPVVVHVIHLGEAPGDGINISDAQIRSAIEVLNDIFRKREGTSGDGGGVDTRIGFCLAVRDPSDQPSDGIVRFDGSDVGTGDASYADFGVGFDGAEGARLETIKGLSRWDSDRYYNIYVVKEINGGGLGGVTAFPISPDESLGTVIAHDKFGTVGTAAGDPGRTLVHELGHGLNLYHTFQGDDGGTRCPADDECGATSDCVADTPPHIRSDFDCRAAEENPCVPAGLLGEVIHNYMDFSSDDCQNEYTAGQRDRMRAAIDVERPGLLASDGCREVTAPVSDFAVSNPTCTGSVTFRDRSTEGPTGWEWSFPGGEPAESTDPNPTVVYDAPGDYEATLTASNSIGAGEPVARTIRIWEAPTDACAVGRTHMTDDFDIGVFQIRLAGIDHASGDAIDDGGYLDLSCTHAATLLPDREYEIFVRTGDTNNEDVKIYIDYNNDGSFNETGERIFAVDKTVKSPVEFEHTGVFRTPAAVAPDKMLRMRVIADFFPNPITGCAELEYGQAEDYGVVFLPGPGDLDANGAVTLRDAVLALKIAAGAAASTDVHLSADVDGNDRLGLPEAVFILKNLAD